MKRRYVLAIAVFGAWCAVAPARAEPVVTLPLNQTAKDKAEQEPPAPAPKPATDKTAAATPKTPLSPQAIITIPPPEFTAEPLGLPAIEFDPSALPPPALAPANEKPAIAARLPQPKPPLPKSAAEKKPPPRGVMQPIDDIPGGKAYVAAPGKAPVFRCFVRDVMAFYDRTHIRCYNKARGKLNFFAVDTGQPVAASVLEKGLAAMQSGKPATITFAPGSDLNPSNCERANCRRLIDIQN
jgi:hypothetical protein